MRAQRREVSRNVMYDVRLANFTNPHIRYGDLHVDRNQTIGGNLDVSGNLTIGGDMRARNYYASGNYYLDNYVLIPAGTIIQSAAINEPAGWLDCDGRTLSVFVNADLFNAIGYTYGGVYRGADVSNNRVADLSFNIPDMRGRVGIGAGTGPGLSVRGLGNISGAETHTLTNNEMPRHNHGGSTGSENAALVGSTGTSIVNDHQVADNGSHSHTIEFDGGNGAHNNMQPFLVLRYLIKY
jgi:microcystin-dependent protein